MSTRLEVERSIGGRLWRTRTLDPAEAAAISQRHGVPEIVGRVLAGRGICASEAEAFLAPRIQRVLPDPSHLLDLDQACARLAEAIRGDERIGLLADYDVDGATSAALLARYLRAVGAAAVVEVPDRLREGYGPSDAVLGRLEAQGCRLILTLDCGTTAFAPLEAAAKRGIEILVIDHHAAEPELPRASAIVNPNRLDQVSSAGDLAAVGVTFLLVVGLNRELRRRGWFATRPEPDVRRWLDLVALGTVCDVVPFCPLNRALVAQGLKVAARSLNPGLARLAQIAGLPATLAVDHLSFGLGPRLNAGSRIGRSSLASALLLAEDGDEIEALAGELHRLNTERQALERRVRNQAARAVAPALAAGAPILIAAGEDWSPGVVGLAASRLVERHHRPAVVIGLENGIGKGSGRSVPEVDLGAAVMAARREGLLLEGGGHPMAAGLTVEAGAIADLTAFLSERVGSTLVAPEGRAPPLEIDGAIRVQGLDLGLARTLGQLQPYGRGNPEPRLVALDARLTQARQVGDGHLQGWLTDTVTGARVRAVAFRAGESALAQALGGSSIPLRIAGRLRVDSYQGLERPSFQIDDAALPEPLARTGTDG